MIMGRLPIIQRRVYPFLIFFCFPICVIERRMVMDNLELLSPTFFYVSNRAIVSDENTPSKT